MVKQYCVKCSEITNHQKGVDEYSTGYLKCLPCASITHLNAQGNPIVYLEQPNGGRDYPRRIPSIWSSQGGH